MKEDMNHMVYLWAGDTGSSTDSVPPVQPFLRKSAGHRQTDGSADYEPDRKTKTRGLEQICQGLGYSPKEAEQLLQKVYEISHVGHGNDVRAPPGQRKRPYYRLY